MMPLSRLYMTTGKTIALTRLLEEDLKVFDVVERLNYYYFVSLDCFPFFLHFLTPLIKFIV